MEPRDHGVEHEADVRPGRGELSLNSTFCVDWGGFARGTTLVGAMAEVSSVNSALRPRVRGPHAGTSDHTHQIYPKNQLRQAASVFSPLMAASATFALKAGLCIRRARLAIVAPDLRHSRRSQADFPLIGLSEFGQPPLIRWEAVNKSRKGRRGD